MKKAVFKIKSKTQVSKSKPAKFPAKSAAEVVRRVEKSIAKMPVAKAVKSFPSPNEAKLIMENQKLRRKIRELQSEVRAMNKTISNGNILVTNLEARLTEYHNAQIAAAKETSPIPEAIPEPKTVEVKFTAPAINDDAGPTVPAVAVPAINP